MTTNKQYTSADAKQAHDYLLQIGKLTVDFAHVQRQPHYASGRPENDVEHSFHLALSAVEMAAQYHPELDVGLVAQFSLVHDLPELYVGDIPTFDITDEAMADKVAAEKVSTIQLLKELPPHLAQLLERYEKQIEPEARFVRFIDKLLPAIIHTVMPEVSRQVFKDAYDITSIEGIKKGEAERIARLKTMFPEFEFVHIVRDLVATTSHERMFKNKAE